MSNMFLQGDALAVLATLPSNYVQCCITSPPYYGLRDYGVEGQIGLEETPEQYISRLVQVFSEVKRVLRHDGIAWVNIGDSYVAHRPRENGQYSNNEGYGEQIEAFRAAQRATDLRNKAGLKNKDLIMIPFRLALALQADGWWVRQTIIWNKPNCMPESVTDRCTTAHEYIFLLAKSERYYYDGDAIREPHLEKSLQRVKTGLNTDRLRNYPGTPQTLQMGENQQMCHELGRNKRSVWTIPTHSYPGSHFATFPPKLIEPMILAGSRPGDIVLDPFSGAGTVALVSLQHGRTPLGIELNPEYIKLAERRVETVQSHLWDSVAEQVAEQLVEIGKMAWDDTPPELREAYGRIMEHLFPYEAEEEVAS